MISMLQQFYHVPAFRYLMLGTPDLEPDNIIQYKGLEINDKLLHQFQKLLSNLELSERSYFNPSEFCFAFKEFDGTPTKIGEQKDAEEFFNLFVDRVETAISKNAEKYVPQEIFGGQFCIQKVCSECGYQSS